MEIVNSIFYFDSNDTEMQWPELVKENNEIFRLDEIFSEEGHAIYKHNIDNKTILKIDKDTMQDMLMKFNDVLNEALKRMNVGNYEN